MRLQATQQELNVDQGFDSIANRTIMFQNKSGSFFVIAGHTISSQHFFQHIGLLRSWEQVRGSFALNLQTAIFWQHLALSQNWSSWYALCMENNIIQENK